MLNVKRLKLAEQDRNPARSTAKCGSSKMWILWTSSKKTMKGHPQIAKQMIEHLPGKTAKQIRDKCNGVLLSPGGDF
jgi:hypothetical protein